MVLSRNCEQESLVFQSSLEFVTKVCPEIIVRITRASPLSLVGKMSVETYDRKHRPR